MLTFENLKSIGNCQKIRPVNGRIIVLVTIATLEIIAYKSTVNGFFKLVGGINE